MIRQAVLLVGGRGTRVWPLTESMPKGLLPVAGVPFIELQFRLLAEVGVEEVILAVGTDHEAEWKAYAETVSKPHIVVSVEQTRLDTAGPVAAVRDRLDDRFLVLNGDVVLEGQLPEFVAGAPDLPAVLSLVRVEDTSAYGVVVTSAAGVVERFIEKPPAGTAPADTVNAGMYLMKKEVLERYPQGRLSFEHVVFPDLVEAGELGGFVIEGEWLDIGTNELYLATHDAVAAGRSRLVKFPDPVPAPWVYVEGGAEIEPGATVEEAIVLDGATIAAGAVVRRAVIGRGAVVEEGAIVTGASLVGENATIGAGCEIAAGARIAPGARLEPGSITFSPPQ
ncbi:MAG: NDP-sugar synthase [Acidimicrobiia bacterium]|nr:NDP-sugar synthase [Acidimicrobiia bacterium]NNF87767.1 NDP-sugar synthase [Acidimicrobiia bacterium]